ncbi:MAG: arginase family protein, partial [Croceitalea sp.]|nr:arginase family protein [Croceitalea sp.]
MGKIALQGIVYDEKSSYLKGPAMAPPLIRAAYHNESANYFAESGLKVVPELFEDCGDFAIKDYFDIESITLDNLGKNLPLITFGGDHSITFPII